MTHDVFKQRLSKIYEEFSDDPMCSHEEADNFLVEVLEGMGFDLSLYKDEIKWYD